MRSPAAPVPHSFLEYVRSFGPGIVIVLTWLGAGDVVDMGAAGANYGYALLWVFVVAILFRFLFVSLIVRYHLCNQHGEGVLDGLARLHPIYAPVLFVAAIVMGHVYGSYMTRGVGEVCRNVFGFGAIWQWARRLQRHRLLPGVQAELQGARAGLLLFPGACSRSRSSVRRSGLASIRPRCARGLVRVEMPGRHGAYDPSHVALAMIGAVGGSLMNLVYPYFLDAKGWRGPQYRRVQLYDFILGMVAMLVLNLSIWILGAELLYPDRHIQQLDDLPNLLSTVLGEPGRVLFYAGHLRRDLHLDHRACGRPGPPRHARLAALARRDGPDHVGLSPSRLLSAGSPSRAWSRRSSGRCPGCPDSSP